MKYPLSTCHLRRSIFVTVCALCLMVHLQKTRQSQDQHQLALGKLTVQQALQRSESLYLLLARKPTPAAINAEPEIFEGRGKRPRHCWYVTCQDGADILANFRWDADSGNLLLANFTYLPALPSFEQPIDRSSAFHIARQLLEVLMLELGTGWRLMEETRLAKGTWIISAQKDQLRLNICLDAASGGVRSIMVLLRESE